MQLYSTIFPVKDSFSKKEFVRLVIQWNQNSPDEQMKGVSWDEKTCDLHFQDGKKDLSVDDLPEEQVIGARFKREDECGVLWTTDFVLNYGEKMLAVRLDRETTDAATSFLLSFSPPHFVTMLLEEGYAGSDGELDIAAGPVVIRQNNYCLIEDVIQKKQRYALPVVYVTKNWNGQYPLNVGQLSAELQGVAHVLKESDPNVSRVLKKSCDGENPHHGGIAIYYPSRFARDQKLNSLRYERGELARKIVHLIYRYMNQQMRKTMYTWEGIQNERLRLKNIALLKKHQKIQDENRDLYEVFEAQLSEYETNIDGLNNRIMALAQENQGLRSKLEGRNEVPLLYFGEEEELYEGEIRDIVLDILEEASRAQKADTRRDHVVRDVLANNESENSQEERRVRIKHILKGYSTMPGSLRHDLEEFGFSIASDGKHYKLTYYDDPRYVVTMAKTCSDARAGSNLASEIARNFL